ncbi:MAG: hypothetical protein LUG90_02415, partial [Clostridiaceae bacterium]|nr:hypothetical protein [Clostridiaceae bacterium]
QPSSSRFLPVLLITVFSLVSNRPVTPSLKKNVRRIFVQPVPLRTSIPISPAAFPAAAQKLLCHPSQCSLIPDYTGAASKDHHFCIKVASSRYFYK